MEHILLFKIYEAAGLLTAKMSEMTTHDSCGMSEI